MGLSMYDSAGDGMQETDRTQLIRLSHAGGKVLVEPEDEDRFVLTAQAAVKACQDQQRQMEAIRTFKVHFLEPLLRWCVARADRVRACYLPAPRGPLQVFVVTSSPKFDFGLAAEVAALELELADLGWRVSVVQIPDTPEDALRTFFDPEGAIEIHAQQPPTQGEGRP
jgi:hypothetical protein